MRIRLNGEDVDFSGNTLADLLVEKGYGDAVVATAVNGGFVAVGMRENQKLAQGDNVEVLAPMQGG